MHTFGKICWMYSPGWHGHTPNCESVSNEVQLGRRGKGKAGSAWGAQSSNGLQRAGRDANGEAITQETSTFHDPTKAPPPKHLQLIMDLLPALDVDHLGQLEHSPSEPLKYASGHGGV